MREFFEAIYTHTKDPHNAIIAWGSITTPRYLTVENLLLDGVIDFDNIPQATDVFFTPGVLEEESRAIDSVIGSSVAWVDLDTYKFDREPKPLLPPTITVNSGRGRQMYWVLDKFVQTSYLAIINKCLSKHLHITGEGTHNPNRVLRVPGSNNCKFLDKKYREQGYTDALPCEIVEFAPERVYAPKQLQLLKPYNLNMFYDFNLENGQPDRSRRDYAIATTLAMFGIDEELIKQSLIYYSSKAREREDYVEGTVAKALTSTTAKKKKTASDDEDYDVANVDFSATGQLMGSQHEDLGMSVLVSWDNQQLHLPATASDFLSSRNVVAWLDKAGAKTRTFYGSDKAAKKLWASLVAQCPTDRHLLVSHAGRHRLDQQELLVYGPNSAMVYPENGRNPDVFWKPDITVESRLDLGDPTDNIDRDSLATILRLAVGSQVPEIMQPALGWLFLNPFKSIIKNDLRLKFPVLMLYGSKGSGKTSLIQDVLLPFLGVQADPIAAELSYYSIIGHLSYWSAWPTWIDEYRISNRNSRELEQLCRSLYDRGRIERGTTNRSVESYELVGNLLISGEDHWADPANLERTVLLHPMKSNIQAGTAHRESYHKLRTWGVEHQAVMARHYLRWSLSKGAAVVDKYYRQGFDLFEPKLVGSVDRVINNVALTWAGLQLFLAFTEEMGIEFYLEPDVDEFLKSCALTTKPGLGTVTAIDNFVVKITSLQDAVPGLRMHWNQDNQILWFNLERVSAILKSTDDLNMMRLQLKERVGVYLKGPKRLPQRGNAEHWGIDIQKAQSLGLNVTAPQSYTTSDDAIGDRKVIRL